MNAHTISRRILVAEDQPHQRKLLERMLSTIGPYEIFSAENGEQALAVLASTPDISLLIADLQMPVMDGVEMLSRLGSLSNPPAVIVCSAEDPNILGAAGQVARSRGLNVLGALEKPVTRVKLAPLLDRFERSHTGTGAGAGDAPSRLLSVAEIGNLMRDDGLTIQIQPKIRLSDDSLYGGEALVRLSRYGNILIKPAAFISVVESDTYLAVELTLAVSRLTSELLATWPKEVRAVPISINLPAACLSVSGIADTLAGAVLGPDVAPQKILWEITETAAIENYAAALETLTRLRLKGFGLAIDDYGTGHSSLERLTSLPFSEVKLDKIFVRGLVSNQVAQKVIASTATLSRDLGLTCVAEGAETRDEIDTLRDLGVDVAQGYGFSRPLDVEAFLEFAKKGVG